MSKIMLLSLNAYFNSEIFGFHKQNDTKVHSIFCDRFKIDPGTQKNVGSQGKFRVCVGSKESGMWHRCWQAPFLAVPFQHLACLNCIYSYFIWLIVSWTYPISARRNIILLEYNSKSSTQKGSLYQTKAQFMFTLKECSKIHSMRLGFTARENKLQIYRYFITFPSAYKSCFHSCHWVSFLLSLSIQ